MSDTAALYTKDVTTAMVVSVFLLGAFVSLWLLSPDKKE